MQYLTYFINFNIRQNREDVEMWKDVSKSLGFLAKTSVPWLLDCVPISFLGIWNREILTLVIEIIGSLTK